MSNFDISDDIMTGLDSDVIDRQIQDAIARLTEQKERILALAMLRGYDGVDITFSDATPTRHWEYKGRIGWEMWMGEPAPLEPCTSRTQRYDFRVLRDHEKEQLLAHVGVFDVEDIRDE